MAQNAGGAQKGGKSNGIAWFVDNNCPDAVQPSPFHDSDCHAVDLPTGLHRTPPSRALKAGGVGVLNHYVAQVRVYCRLSEETRFVVICNDVGTLIPPIKAHRQSLRAANTGKSGRKWGAGSGDARPGGKDWQAYLQSHDNRYDIARSIRGYFDKMHMSEKIDVDTLIFYGCGDIIPSGDPDTPFGMEESKESDGARRGSVEGGQDRKDLWVWRCGERTTETSRGPCIGEGGLATTHFLVRNVSRYDAPNRRTRWTITSTDKNQMVHVLLAMASGFVEPAGVNGVDVTVRGTTGKG